MGNGGKERRARGKLQGIMESTKKQKAALEKRLEEAEDIDTDSDEDEGGGKKAGGGASKMLGMFGAKAGAGGKISGLNRWTGLKKGLFSVRSFRKQKMTAQIRLKAICIAAAYYVLLFQHQPASVKTFNMFKCQKIEDTYFLRPDFRLTCFPLNGYHAFAGAIMAVGNNATTAVMISAPMAKPIKMKPGARTSSTASAMAADSQTHQMLTIVSIIDGLSAV